MTGKRVMPTQKYEPRLHIRTNQTIQDGGHNKRHSDWNQILGVGEHGPKSLNSDRICLNNAI
jgi:hypothetical protein